MDTPKRYRNRHAELERLINVLRGVGISRVEELTKLLAQTIQSYANQLHIEPLTFREIEYVWIKLLD
jgi:hypothetical protein